MRKKEKFTGVSGVLDLCKSKINDGLRFRDMEIFNQVLIAKQICQGLDIPHTSYKVLKHCYFCKWQILDVKLGSCQF